MDYQRAQFVRFIAADEDSDDLLNDVKAETWTRRAEHAVLTLKDGRRALVRGGADGIELELDNQGRPQLTAEGVKIAIVELLWHTHPRATGPSDYDRRLLELLGQESSVVHEINGVPGGTIFFRKRDEPS